LGDLQLKTGEIKEIAAFAGVPENILASLVGVSCSESLDDPGTRNGRRARRDFSEEITTSSSNEIYDSRVLKEHVQRSVSHLREQERKVITLRFGLNDGVERTLQEVGELMGLSRERIRQVEVGALVKLRRSLSS
jgi:RNA polymerase primary sigma factor